MIFIINYTLKWLVQGWILSRLAKRVRAWLVKKYELQGKFEQSSPPPHDLPWIDYRWYAELSAYIYKKPENFKKKYEKFDIYMNEINDIRYAVLTDSSTKRQYVTIRGTANSHNALQDIKFFKDKSFRLGINIHTGFHRTAEMIADDLLSRNRKSYQTYVTGHSLGGAAACVTSWYLDYAGHNIAECITFGQPKVTDSHGIRKMRGKIKLTRIVNETDVVALVPPAGTHMNRFAHGGTLVKLLDNGKFCYLDEPDSLNFGVNSFWLFASRESFSFYEIGKELPDHYMTNYLENIDNVVEDGEEVLWKNRLNYIEDSGILGEFKK